MDNLLSQYLPELTQTHQFDNLLTTNNKNQLIQAKNKSETQSRLFSHPFADQNLQNSSASTKRMEQTRRQLKQNEQVTDKHEIQNERQAARKTSCKYRTVYRSLEGGSRQYREQRSRKSEKTEKALSCNKKGIINVEKLIQQSQYVMDKAANKHESSKDHCYSSHLQVIESLKNVTINHKFDALAAHVRMFVHYNLAVAYLKINQLLGKLEYSQYRIHFHIQSFMRALDSVYQSAATVPIFDINQNPNYGLYLKCCNILLFQGRQKISNISDFKKKIIYNYESYCHSTCIVYFAFIRIIQSYSILGQCNDRLLDWLQNMISDINLTTNSVQKHTEKLLSEAGYVNTKLKREKIQLKRWIKDHIKQLGLNNVCRTQQAVEKFCHSMRDQHRQMKMQNFCVLDYEKCQFFRQKVMNAKLDRINIQKHVSMCLMGQSYAVAALCAIFDSLKQAYPYNYASSFIQDSKDILRRALHLSQEYLKESQLCQQIKQKFLSLLQDQACIRQATKQQESEQQDENQYHQSTLKEASADTLQGEQLILDKLKRLSVSNQKQTRAEQMIINMKNDLKFVVNNRTKMRSLDMPRSEHKGQLQNWSRQKEEGKKGSRKDNKVAQKIRQTYRRVLQQSSQTSRKQQKKKSPGKLRHYMKDAINIRFSFEKATEQIQNNERVQNKKQVISHRNRKVLESRQRDRKIQDCEYFMQQIDTIGCQLLRKNQKEQRMIRIKEEKYRNSYYHVCQ